MLNKKLTQSYADDFMIVVASGVSGIGSAKAGHVSSDFEHNYLEFIAADEVRLKAIQTSKKKQLLSETEIADLIEYKSNLQVANDINQTWLLFLGRKFILASVESVKALTLESFDFNPFLAIALDLKNPKDVISFNVYQTVTRSIVTSWGSMVEDMLKYSGDADKVKNTSGGRKGRSPDLVKVKNGIKYFIQIKSGPNTMNVDMVNSLNEVMSEYESKKRTKFLLGMTYGTRGQISQQIKQNLQDFNSRTLIGRELWAAIPR